jgi:hypothetical protein
MPRLFRQLSTNNGFAALKADGSITSWGSPGTRGIAPSDSGYTKIYSTYGAFAALKAESPHTLIDPSALRAAKAPLVE